MPATVLGRELAPYLLAGKRSGFGHDLAIAWGFAAWGRSYVFGPFFFFFVNVGMLYVVFLLPFLKKL